MKDTSRYAARKVLIVEDKAAMRQIIRTILLFMGFGEIEEATNGREALQKLKAVNKVPAGESISEKPFDLVISDWMMPNMDGLTFLREVREDVGLFPVYFLMLTSQNDEESVMQARDNGVTDYIIKPFPAKVLEEKIKSILK